MKIVTRTEFDSILKEIVKHDFRSLDTETTGLFPYHGDRLFSMIIGTDKEEYYFNWNEYPELPSDMLLDPTHKHRIQERLFNDFTAYWFIHQAIYDCPILYKDEVSMEIKGVIHCTMTGARVQYNEHNKYTLDACGERIKIRKDTAVEDYIAKNKLFTYRDMNGYKIKCQRYDLVPFPIITKYGCRDARIGYNIGIHQVEKIKERADRQPKDKNNIRTCHANELRLQKTLNKIQNRGARVDRGYCKDAIDYFTDEMSQSQTEFKSLTGRDFILSGKLFAELFVDEKEKWGKTEKGNPSFDADVLATFENPAASQVVRYKEAKAKINFFHSFLKFSDSEGFIHTELKPFGTRTGGRFSSANPNLQNLEKAKGDALNAPFVVRRAFIPRDGFFFAMLDYDQIEYRMMLDYAKANELIDKVLGGLDVHTATAEVANVSRDQAKTVNFLTLYGGGIAKLAGSLGTSQARAKEIQSSIFNAAPQIKTFIRQVIRTAEQRGYIFNWLGRVSYFPKRNLCYKAPNTLIQGGAGDVAKVSMNLIDEHLNKQAARSNLLLNVHDEIILEMHYDEAEYLYDIKKLMEETYPHQRLPLTCGIEWSNKSLADKQEFTGLDCLHAKEGRDTIQGKDLPSTEESSQHMGQEVSVGGS